MRRQEIANVTASRFRLFVHRGHDAEARVAAEHVVLGGRGLYEGEGLNHRADAGERTEFECVFRKVG